MKKALAAVLAAVVCSSLVVAQEKPEKKDAKLDQVKAGLDQTKTDTIARLEKLAKQAEAQGSAEGAKELRALVDSVKGWKLLAAEPAPDGLDLVVVFGRWKNVLDETRHDEVARAKRLEALAGELKEKTATGKATLLEYHAWSRHLAMVKASFGTVDVTFNVDTIAGVARIQKVARGSEFRVRAVITCGGTDDYPKLERVELID
jgi:hypothetical protein